MSHNLRNFAILAHIDHGKSTLADRFLELTKTVESRTIREQYLDSMDIERERGITIKMQPVKMRYEHGGEEYVMNLIDTPGHVDFSYEVSRALAAVEGGLLLVDATSGVQAQTVAHLQTALEQGLTIIPVINKVDLPQANPDAIEEEILSLFATLDYEPPLIRRISAKTGLGVEQLLADIVEHVPPPKQEVDAPARALIFDSLYDDYRGVITHIRVVEGVFGEGDKLRFMASDASAEAKEVGYFSPKLVRTKTLEAGDIGYIASGLKNVELARIGDTITLADPKRTATAPIAGYRQPQPLVFSTIFPRSDSSYEELLDAFGKLKLNDASLFYEPEYSQVLGRGLKVGFLGMLHMEIILERLRREYGLDLIITAPSVAYEVELTNGERLTVFNPAQYPDPGSIRSTQEPWAHVEIIVPTTHLNNAMSLLKAIRGEYKDTEYIGMDRVRLHYEAPLADIISDFYDNLKNVTSGFGSLSYSLIGYRDADVVKLDILLAEEPVEALSRFVPRARAEAEGRKMVEKIKDTIPAEQFAVAIQAAIGGKVIARETKSAMRKNVTAGLYGGDFSRKKKQLQKQKKGKQRLKEFGRVQLDSETLMKLFR